MLKKIKRIYSNVVIRLEIKLQTYLLFCCYEMRQQFVRMVG